MVFSEIQGFQNNMSVLGARGVGVRAVYMLDVSPLVDEKGFITVLEPRQVTKPSEIHRHRTVIQKEASEQQERDNDWRTNRQSHGDAGAYTRDEVTERNSYIGY